MMPYTVTADFQQVEYVACYMAFDEPFTAQRDVALIGFRPNDGSRTVVVFPTLAKAREWGKRWFRINKRKRPNLTEDIFSTNEMNLVSPGSP